MEKILGLIFAGVVGIILLAITLTNHEVGRRDAKAPALLFAADAADVDSVTIEGPDGNQLSLLRKGDGWVLPDLDNFPADSHRVDDMLKHLLAIRQDFPVASDPDALIRFKLGDENFERRITLFGGGETLGTLYLGTPEGPRQTHARPAGGDTAYAVLFGLFDAPVAAGDWTDKGVLRVAEADIAGIQVNGLHLMTAVDSGGDNPWQLDDAEPGQTLDAAAAKRLADRLAGLQVEAVLGRENSAANGLDAPELRLSVILKDGSRIDYRLGRAGMTGFYTLKASSRPEYFRLSSYAAHQLIEAARREVLLAKTNQHAAAE
jgi:Domain of unknown function (DUF4340)